MLPLASLTAASLPVLSALLAGLFAARLAGSCLVRPAPHRACWAAGFLLFAGAAAAEAYGASYGWSPVTFRLYYLFGGVLSVGLLGLGAVWLHLPRPVALLATGALLACIPASAVAVLAASVDVHALDVARLRPPPDHALHGLAFLWAIALNSLGTIALVGGCLRSLRRRQRVRANVLLLAGLAAVALSGSLTRFGSYALVYAGQLAGIVCLFAGFELASRRSAPAGGRSRRRLLQPLGEG